MPQKCWNVPHNSQNQKVFIEEGLENETFIYLKHNSNKFEMEKPLKPGTASYDVPVQLIYSQPRLRSNS